MVWNCFLVWFSVHFSRFSPIQGAKVPPARFVQGAVPLQQLDHKHGQRRHLPFRHNPHSPDGGFPSERDLPPALRLRPRGSRIQVGLLGLLTIRIHHNDYVWKLPISFSSFYTPEKQAVKNKNFIKIKSKKVSTLMVLSSCNKFIPYHRRYRLFPRFKARLTNTPYEDIVISEGKPSKPSPA